METLQARRHARNVLLHLKGLAGGAPLKGPLVVAGLFSDNRGIAEAAKLSVRALEKAGLAPLQHDVTSLIHGEPPPPPPGKGGVLLLHLNPPEALALLYHWPRRHWANRYRVGYWNWELDRPAPGWGAAWGLFQEVWVPSAFAARAFRGIVRQQNPRVMPLPVPAPTRLDGRAMRARIGLRPETVMVLSGFDMRSSRNRKNPDAALSAYENAVPIPSERATMLLKISGHDLHPCDFASLRARVAGRPDVRILTEQLDNDAMQELVAACDIFVSLHRAEGFGLWIAQAMRAGKPVVATGWSGNMDFMDAGSAALVPFTLTPVLDPGGAYDGIAALWAEPDTSVATSLLQELLADEGKRHELGERAAAYAGYVLDTSYSRARLTSRLLDALKPQ